MRDRSTPAQFILPCRYYEVRMGACQGHGEANAPDVCAPLPPIPIRTLPLTLPFFSFPIVLYLPGPLLSPPPLRFWVMPEQLTPQQNQVPEPSPLKGDTERPHFPPSLVKL